MTRNMDRRIEVVYPIEDSQLKNRLKKEILDTYWKDNIKSRVLNTNGTYTLKKPSSEEPHLRAQSSFIELARKNCLQSIPYNEAIHHKFELKGRRPLLKPHTHPNP